MTNKNIDNIVDAMITYALIDDFVEMKNLAKECILLDHTNVIALQCHALARINEENWSDISVFFLGKYIKETYKGCMTGHDSVVKCKLANLIDETLSINILDHIQDCQYWYENNLDATEKKTKGGEFCSHTAALIDCIFESSIITLSNAPNDKAIKNGLNMLDSCVACIDEVGAYLDDLVCSKKLYSDAKREEIINLVRSLRLKQTILYDNGEDYPNLYDLFY